MGDSIFDADTESTESRVITKTQCFRLSTNVRKFMPKSSDLRTYYLPGGQTDAEVLVKRNINISSIYEAVLYLFHISKQKWTISCCLLVTAHAWDEKG